MKQAGVSLIAMLKSVQRSRQRQVLDPIGCTASHFGLYPYGATRRCADLRPNCSGKSFANRSKQRRHVCVLPPLARLLHTIGLHQQQAQIGDEQAVN